MEEISELIRCVKNIEEMTRPLLKRLWRNFQKASKSGNEN
jgi:hypothetical protein